MIKINRAKLAPKLMLLTVLLITVFTGFACFAVAKEDKRSTKLAFTAEEGWTHWVWIPVGDPWEEDGMLHQRYYKEASLEGTIEEIGDFLGRDELSNPEGSYDVLDLHVRIDPATGKMISIGKVTMYIFIEDEENGDVGTFYGSIIAKGTLGPMGPLAMDGKYTLQGTGDFEGMKLFGTVSLIVGPINGLSGTILDPN